MSACVCRTSENCKSLVLKGKCKIEIFLSPAVICKLFLTQHLLISSTRAPSINSHSVPLPYTVWSQSDGIVIVVVVFNIDLYSLVLQLSHTQVLPSVADE